MQSTSALVATFRSKGLKITPQRLAIFDALQGDAGHPTALTVYERVRATMPAISLRTVYQALNDLADMGMIRCISIGGDAARYDPNTAEHHHLVCSRCGAITDTYLDVSSLRPEGAEAFDVTRASVVLEGTCARCATAGPNRSA